MSSVFSHAVCTLALAKLRFYEHDGLTVRPTKTISFEKCNCLRENIVFVALHQQQQQQQNKTKLPTE